MLRHLSVRAADRLMMARGVELESTAYHAGGGGCKSWKKYMTTLLLAIAAVAVNSYLFSHFREGRQKACVLATD